MRHEEACLEDAPAQRQLTDRLLLILAAAAVAIGLSLVSDIRPETAEAAPYATTSRYMSTADYTTSYYEGWVQGSLGSSGVVVLDFGQPDWNGVTYGTWLFNNSFVSTSVVANAAHGYLAGYFNHSPSGVYLHLAVGTNNYFGYTGYGHGQAWAQMINGIGSWISSPPSYASKETIDAGSDMETGWGNPSTTRAWADGYASAFQYPYYDYGDAGGCPPYGSCNGLWYQEDVYHVSWGAQPAWPLPDIYCQVCYAGDTNGGNAAQWYQMSLYAYVNHGSRMAISGSMTQWYADGQCCTNSPDQGWTQLYNALNADWRTAQSLAWSTDLTWAN
jgi:hypothetical protein